MKIKAWFKDVHNEARYEQYMRETCTDNGWHPDGDELTPIYVGHPAFIACLIDVVVLRINDAIGALICRYRGHDYEDSGSWAGPNSGGDDLTCRRCGHHIHHVYY